MTNPVEEYLQIKQANFMGKAWEGAKSVAESPAFQMPVATLGVAVAGRAILRGLDNAVLAVTKKRDFNSMMEHNPDLQDYYQENSKRFNAHFTSLRSMNPHFSQDPIVAGSYMRQMSVSPTTAGTAVVHSISAGRGLPQGALAATAEGPMPRVDIQSPQQKMMEQLKIEEMRAAPGERSSQQALREQEFAARENERQQREWSTGFRDELAEKKERREAERHGWAQEDRHGR